MKKCLQEQVIPKSILPRRLLLLTEGPFDDFQRDILNKHIKLTAVEVKGHFKMLKDKKFEFNNIIPITWNRRLNDYCYSELRRICEKLKRNLKRKLDRLIEDSP